MSGWDQYVQSVLSSDPCIVKVAIIGVPDGSLWSKTKVGLGKEFALKPEEVKCCATMWAKIEELPGKGLTLEGIKYVVPVVDPEGFIIGKAPKEKNLGICAVRTNKACIVAQFVGERDAGVKCRMALDRIGSHLKSSGY